MHIFLRCNSLCGKVHIHIFNSKFLCFGFSTMHIFFLRCCCSLFILYLFFFFSLYFRNWAHTNKKKKTKTKHKQNGRLVWPAYTTYSCSNHNFYYGPETWKERISRSVSRFPLLSSWEREKKRNRKKNLQFLISLVSWYVWFYCLSLWNYYVLLYLIPFSPNAHPHSTAPTILMISIHETNKLTNPNSPNAHLKKKTLFIFCFSFL